MIVVHATNFVREDKVEQFETATKAYEAIVNETEPGTVIYCMARTRKDPLVYRNVEIFRDRAAIEAHGATAHLQAAIEATKDCFSQPPIIEICDSLLEHQPAR